MTLVGSLLPPVLGLFEVLFRLADEITATELELAVQIAALGLLAQLLLFIMGDGLFDQRLFCRRGCVRFTANGPRSSGRLRG